MVVHSCSSGIKATKQCGWGGNMKSHKSTVPPFNAVLSSVMEGILNLNPN